MTQDTILEQRIQSNQPIEKSIGHLNKPLGSLIGFFSTIIIGFGIYFLLLNMKSLTHWLPYDTIVKNADNSLFYKIVWFFMDFTGAQFYAGFFASIGLILGGFIAWRLSVKQSPLAGFDICYGTNLWPWVLTSQVISLSVAIFVLDYTQFFASGDYTWLPTFISVVGIPPAIILLYGPSVRALVTGSILGGVLGFPVAFWFMTKIIPVLGVPIVVGNVATMAVTGIIVFQICHVLPWMKKTPIKGLKTETTLTKEEQLQKMMKPTWFIRRVIADFSEAQFYGNEIAGLCLLLGVIVEWLLNHGHAAYGTGTIPAILLSQFIGSGVGVYLYTYKYLENGWYPTFIPIVSIGPACVLMFGATISIAVIAGVLGGIMGAPVAEYFSKKLPDYVHPAVANVTSMAICTIVIALIIQVLPWF